MASVITRSPILVEWMWLSDANSSSTSESVEWNHYSDVENSIIEEAFSAGKAIATLDDVYTDFEHNIQVSDNDIVEQRPIQRQMRTRKETYLREERFMANPTPSKNPFSCLHGWVSDFVLEVKKDLKLKKEQLPSNDPNIVPEIVEKAAHVIIEQGISKRNSVKLPKYMEMLCSTLYDGKFSIQKNR